MVTSILYRTMSEEKKPWWHDERRNAWLLAGALSLVLLGLLRWFTLPTPRYFWPKAAEDWSAWGQCVGAVGTVLAVVYAARTLQSTSDAQIQEQRDRRLEMDFLEAKEAEDAVKLRPDTAGFPRESDEWGHSEDVTGARIFVQNFSEHPFHEVQVFIPENSFQKGLPLTNIEFWEADLELDEETGRRPGRWSVIDSPGPPLPGTNLFTLGTVLPGKCRSVSFDFSGYESMLNWDHNVFPGDDGFSRDIMLIVAFVDRNGKTWQRTSRDGGQITRLRREL
nr:hypothetical protein [Arthrobacter sp. J3.37]